MMWLELVIPLFLIALFLHLRPLSAPKPKSKRGLTYPPSPYPCLPFVGHLHLLKLPLHHSLIRLSKRYGPLYSLYFGSMPTVVVSTPELFKLFLQTHEASHFNTRFQTSAIKRLTYNNSVAVVPYGPYWKFVRKLIMNDLLNSSTVQKLRPLRIHEMNKLLRVLANHSLTRQPLNLSAELYKWTSSTISMMMLGEAHEEIRESTNEILKIFGEYNLSDFIAPLKKFRVGEYEKRTEDIFNKFDPLIEKIIKRRQEVIRKRRERNGQLGEDDNVVFLDTLLEFAEDETMEIQISKDQIKGLIVDFFSAGTDSTAVATDWTLAELINNPRVFQKAREEVDRVVGRERVVDESDVQNLPYIRALIKESSRLHPPLPVVKRICVSECVIEDYVIPEGALVLFNVWAVGRDPKYWDNPSEFRPERFLENVEGEQPGPIDLRGQHFQLLPFGSGRRMCPGVNLATQGMATLLASIIQCFDLHVVGPQGQLLKGEDAKVSMEERPGLAVPRVHSLVCVPVPRANSPVKLLSA